jgi:hypothetical protein
MVFCADVERKIIGVYLLSSCREEDLGSGKEKGRKKRGTSPASSKEKGAVVKKVVAMMHEAPGVEVRRDVLLPAKNDSSRRRQFDVLLVGNVAGYQTVLAVECKNYGRAADVGDVGRFRDHLEDVGLAPQQGILVSASGFTSGALGRAEELGMRAYELSGLSPDRLSEAVHEASQLVVSVMPFMSRLSVVSEVPDGASTTEVLALYDTEGRLVGSIPDLLWMRWLEGEPGSVLGEHELEIPIPKGWHARANGERARVRSVSAKVEVGAAVVELPGTATGVALVDPKGRGVQKARAAARFENAPGEYPVRNFRHEEELAAYLEGQRTAFKVTIGRIRAPRIRLEHVYWPPSERVARRMKQLEKFHMAGRIGLSPENLRGVEGTDLSTIWQPIVRGYPAVEYLRRREDG